MEITPQATPLVLAGQDQPIPRALQFAREQQGVRDGADLSGQLVEQATVRGAKPFASRFDDEQQRPQITVTPSQRNALWLLMADSVFDFQAYSPRRIVEFDGGVAEPQRPCQRAEDSAQDNSWFANHLDLVQPRCHGIGLRTVSEDPATQQSLQPQT